MTTLVDVDADTDVRCPRCGSVDVSFDWDAIVSVRITGGKLTTVSVGGVLGVPPDRIFCPACGDPTPMPAGHLADDVFDLLADTAPAPVLSALEDGIDLHPATNQPAPGR